MARLYSCGFELQSVTNGVEWDTTTGSPTIDTTTKRSGAASLNCSAVSNSSVLIAERVTDSSTIYVRFYLYITTTFGADKSIFDIINSAGFSTVGLNLQTDRTLRLAYLNPSDAWTEVGTASSVLETGTWYEIEFYGKYNSSSSEDISFRVNESTVDTQTVSVYDDGVTNYRIFEFGIDTYGSGGTTGNINIDDIAINNNAGTVQNSYPGAGSIIHMQPDSAGDAAATTGDYTAIDEVTPNDATDYIEIDTDAGGQQANYNFESWTEAGGNAGDTITLVQVGIRHRAETAASMSYTPQIKSQTGGTTLDGTATAHNDITWKTNGDTLPKNYKLTSYVDPQAGGAWTPTLLDSMIAGVNVTDGNPDVWISTIWALVEYVPYTGPVTYPSFAITFIHNKADNTAQVTGVTGLLVLENGLYRLDTTNIYPTNFYHVLPYNTSVSNQDTLNGCSTICCDNCTENHLFNLALQRGGDVGGGEALIIVRDHTTLTVADIISNLALLTGTVMLVTTSSAYYIKDHIIRECGYLEDDISFDTAMTNYKNVLTSKGYTYI